MQSIPPQRKRQNHSPTLSERRAQIALWIENLLDADTLVDDARAAMARAHAELERRQRERDRVLEHLANLIALIATFDDDDREPAA
jgi:hypothetical protein